ncbi:MAG TPA: YoaK family protein [Acidimicrobiales bacterium]|nr:YoaK family protein [Acidimicrobiales bacterium]
MTRVPDEAALAELGTRGDGPSGPGRRARLGALPLPPVAVGVYAITAVCGLLDAASFLGLGQVFVEIMTGNLVFLAFVVGASGLAGPALTTPGVVPYVVALSSFALGAVGGGRLVRAGESGRRWGFVLEGTLVGAAVVTTAVVHPGTDGHARFAVIAILATAMGIQNALMRRWGIPDLATNVMTLTLTGVLADSTLGGGHNPRAVRRATSILVFVVSAGVGAFLTRYGVLWPMLVAAALFCLALPVLVQPQR